MTRDLRARHAMTWVLLGPVLVVIVVALLALRPAPFTPAPPAPPTGAAP